MGARCDTDVDIFVKVAVEVAANPMHCRVKLGLELNTLVAIVVDFFLSVGVVEFKTKLLLGYSTMIVKKNNIYIESNNH